ncbi:unnamed protein product [Closterium sp. Yama58-4]|nr:unnamed protein product [Closterium sp. Yama58-4]
MSDPHRASIFATLPTATASDATAATAAPTATAVGPAHRLAVCSQDGASLLTSPIVSSSDQELTGSASDVSREAAVTTRETFRDTLESRISEPEARQSGQASEPSAQDTQVSRASRLGSTDRLGDASLAESLLEEGRLGHSCSSDRLLADDRLLVECRFCREEEYLSPEDLGLKINVGGSGAGAGAGMGASGAGGGAPRSRGEFPRGEAAAAERGEKARGAEARGAEARGAEARREEARGARMVKPCACGGTMGRVHLRCLQQWIERRRLDGCDHDALTCEVCRSPYRLRIHERLDLTWERLCSYASISFYAEFCTICATLASMVFLFFLIVIGDSDEVCGGVGRGGKGCSGEGWEGAERGGKGWRVV